MWPTMLLFQLNKPHYIYICVCVCVCIILVFAQGHAFFKVNPKIKWCIADSDTCH